MFSPLKKLKTLFHIQRDTGVWDQALTFNFTNPSPEFQTAYQTNLLIGGPEGILGLLTNHSLDALILPTAFSPGLPALIGAPVITVPLGFYPADEPVVRNKRATLVETGPNIPFGISFLGPLWSEAPLIGFAYAFEQRTRVRDQVQPYLVPRTELADVVLKGGKNATTAGGVNGSVSVQKRGLGTGRWGSENRVPKFGSSRMV